MLPGYIVPGPHANVYLFGVAEQVGKKVKDAWVARANSPDGFLVS
jgi:hypothetical protein